MALGLKANYGNEELDYPWVNSVAAACNQAAQVLQGWVADDAQNPSLGTLPADTYVTAVRIQVTEAFNSDGTDEISVGWDASVTALATATDVATTGIKTVTAGASIGYNATSRALEAYYVNGGTEPTTGKALVQVEYHNVAAEVA